MDPYRVAVVIPAAGRGTRMGGPTPKQYLPLLGRPVLWHTVQQFAASPVVASIILAIHPDDAGRCERAGLRPGRVPKLKDLVTGGGLRWESVRAGVAATTCDDDVVLVHDAVRPLVSQDLIARVAAAAWSDGAAIAALPVTETIKRVRDGRIQDTPPRDALWNAQTPQGFRRAALVAALKRAGAGQPFTDDASLVEASGQEVRVVEGDVANIKITTPRDLAWAEWELKRRNEDMEQACLRVGQGYDVHALVPGRPLVLGGVAIPFELGLQGHSDADVVTHAVIDAVLGAAALGDIGRHFPDTDEQYRGISSIELLARTRELLAARGGQVLNVDAVVVAQRPRLAPHIASMAQNLARGLGIETETVSVKATTSERLGFAGRGEGMAAQAVVLVRI